MQSKDIRPDDSDQSELINVDAQTSPYDQVHDDASFPADEFQNYQMLSLIHAGKTGDVFKVKRIGLDQTFALKIFKAELLATLGEADRFERECKAIASLTHENLSTVYEHGKSTNGTPFIVTDFVDAAASLEQLVQSEGALNDARVLEISLQLCSLFDYLEQKGLAARGLALSDVLVTKKDSGTEIVKVVDLGIAKIFDSTEDDSHSAEPSVQPAANYFRLTMQDLTNSFRYSEVRMLGGLMFWLLTGKSIGECQNANQVLLADDPARATRIVLDKDGHELKRDMRLAAGGALQMAGTTPYGTIQDLQRALQKISKGESLAPAKAIEISQKRKRLWAIVVGIAISGVAIAIPFFTHPANTSVTKTKDAAVLPPKTYTGSQQIKDNYGRVLYASNAPDQSTCVTEALNLGINLAGAQFKDVLVSGVSVGNTSLANATFNNCTLFAWTVSDVNLDGVTFSGCKLKRMTFNKSTFASAKLKDCTLNSTTFSDSKLLNAKFENCDTGSAARKGKQSGVTFQSCGLNGVHFTGGNWSNNKFLSPMQDVVATFNLSDSTIACTSLRGADFSGATVVSSKIIAPDAKSLKFKSVRDTTVEQKFPEVEKKIGEAK